jgi:hypothetical protein
VKVPKKSKWLLKIWNLQKSRDFNRCCEIIRKISKENIEIVIAGTDSPNTPGYLRNQTKIRTCLQELRFHGLKCPLTIFNESNNGCLSLHLYNREVQEHCTKQEVTGKQLLCLDVDLSLLVEEEGIHESAPQSRIPRVIGQCNCFLF